MSSSEQTRRQFLEVAGTAAALTLVAPTALASAQVPQLPSVPGVPVVPGVTPEAGSSPAPVGPGAPYSSYQSEIYIAGMSTGVKPIFTTDLSDIEEAAAKVLSEAARRNLLRWAGGARAVRVNETTLESWRLVPRMLIDRAKRDLKATVLGAEMPAPVIFGPVGNQRSAHRDGEAASARAAAALGLTYTHASQASLPVEAVAAAAPTGPRWFALDWPRSGDVDRASLLRAKTAGCRVLLLNPPQPGQGWGALADVRKAWDGPIVVNGIQSVVDARRAVRRGLDGVVVSNERGRRGRDPIGTIDVLPQVVDAVGSKVPVLFGSGVRTGTDVYRALALGATAVMLGRPYVHGLALGGEDGVRHMLRTLLAELDITLAIAGVASQGELTPAALLRA